MQTYGGEKLEKQAFVVYSERGSRGREREMRISWWYRYKKWEVVNASREELKGTGMIRTIIILYF